MVETVYYESGKHRIEVSKLDASTFMWFQGKPNGDWYGPCEYHGMQDTLEECLDSASEEILSENDAPWLVSPDQKTEVR